MQTCCWSVERSADSRLQPGRGGCFVQQHVPKEEAVRATVILTMIPSFGRLLGSLCTGWLNELGGYPLAFFVSTGSAGLALLFLIPVQEKKNRGQIPSLACFARLMARRDVLVTSFLNGIGQYAVMGAVFGFIPSWRSALVREISCSACWSRYM